MWIQICVNISKPFIPNRDNIITAAKTTFFSMFLKVASRRNGLIGSWNCWKCLNWWFWVITSSSSSDTCRALFGRLPRPASCFALSSNTSLDELNQSRSRTMDRVQPLSIKRCNHYLKAFWFIIFTFFIVYFGVEKLEQSVTLSQLIIFYLSTNNARQEERIVKVM